MNASPPYLIPYNQLENYFQDILTVQIRVEIHSDDSDNDTLPGMKFDHPKMNTLMELVANVYIRQIVNKNFEKYVLVRQHSTNTLRECVFNRAVFSHHIYTPLYRFSTTTQAGVEILCCCRRSNNLNFKKLL